MFENALLLIFPAAMIFAAMTDLFTMTIPNKVSLALVAGFVLVVPFAGLSLEQVALHVASGLFMLTVCLFMFWRGWMGGGDAKLLSAAALWLGYDLLLPYSMTVGLFGGVLALGLLGYRAFIPEFWVMKFAWAERLHQKDGGIPYGIAIAAGAVWVYPQTQWFTGLAAAMSS